MNELLKQIVELTGEAMRLKGENTQLRERIAFLEKMLLQQNIISTASNNLQVMPSAI